ncbi:GNAT family N-acetyltransferase [Erysipelothrix sp. HDW6C]|uniref:GNAT family N-acetyltransferase n=1 Tax=Erysipelothrix sp. HDW6C TaxID=2714930 RepID=UPI00140C6630|nr:GNAT family N-acetyltransferase [Erysipelothrix sp. HDW6C]QIK69866.1 GNAT family N-acetyltransferase [Erysipelothrix sp. HDW6C]
MRKYLLETKRIGFSTWHQDDLYLAQSLWGNPGVTQFIVANGIMDEAAIHKRLYDEITMFMNFGIQYYPIFELDSGMFIGCCGVRPYADKQNTFEVGVHLCESSWGQGFAREAVTGIIDYATETLGIANIVAGHHPNNMGSQTLLKSVGFVYQTEVLYPPTGLYHPLYSLEIK